MDQRNSILELQKLADTLNILVRDEDIVLQTRQVSSLGKGRFQDLVSLRNEEEEQPTVVLFDDDRLRSSQIKSYQEKLGGNTHVYDRTSLILNIFKLHARSQQAKAQVELAELKLKGEELDVLGTDDREGGGGKGIGEAQAELSKRGLKNKIAALRKRLVVIEKEAGLRTASRENVPSVALVGYTNAGKSSLMRTLTGSDVLVENKLFATLDTTVRELQHR